MVDNTALSHRPSTLGRYRVVHNPQHLLLLPTRYITYWGEGRRCEVSLRARDLGRGADHRRPGRDQSVRHVAGAVRCADGRQRRTAHGDRHRSRVDDPALGPGPRDREGRRWCRRDWWATSSRRCRPGPSRSPSPTTRCRSAPAVRSSRCARCRSATTRHRSRPTPRRSRCRASRSARRCVRWCGRHPPTMPGRCSPACSSPPRTTGSRWSPPTRTGSPCAICRSRRCWPPARRCSCRGGRWPSCNACCHPMPSCRSGSVPREAVFEVGGTRLTTRLIEGEYPNYRNLLPSSYPNQLTVGREALMEALRRVKILAQDSTPVRLALGGDTLRLTAITQDVGNAHEEIDAAYDGTEMTVAFNPDYLTAGVEAVEGDEVTLSTLDPMKPAVLRGVGHDEYLYLLMPSVCRSGRFAAGRSLAMLWRRLGSLRLPRRRRQTWAVIVVSRVAATIDRVGSVVIVERLELVDFRNYRGHVRARRRGSRRCSGATGRARPTSPRRWPISPRLSSFRGAPPDAMIRVAADTGRDPRHAARRRRTRGADRGRALAHRAQSRPGQPATARHAPTICWAWCASACSLRTTS